MKKVKVIIVGNSHVGKTCLLCQFLDSSFQLEFQTTIAPDKSIKQLNLLNTDITLEIWDTAGQDNYAAANKIYMKKADIALIVYDITDKESFENLQNWYDRVIQINDKNKVIFGVAANKSDLFEKQVVSTEDGQNFSKKINALFFETSAKDHGSVEKAFNGLAQEYYHQYLERQKMEKEEEKKMEEEKKEDNVVLDENKHKESVIKEEKKKRRC
jgi:small GTP-binding protein